MYLCLSHFLCFYIYVYTSDAPLFLVRFRLLQGRVLSQTTFILDKLQSVLARLKESAGVNATLSPTVSVSSTQSDLVNSASSVSSTSTASANESPRFTVADAAETIARLIEDVQSRQADNQKLAADATDAKGWLYAL